MRSLCVDIYEWCGGGEEDDCSGYERTLELIWPELNLILV